MCADGCGDVQACVQKCDDIHTKLQRSAAAVAQPKESGADMCAGMCVDMPADMRADMCIDMRIDLCQVVCIDM